MRGKPLIFQNLPNQWYTECVNLPNSKFEHEAKKWKKFVKLFFTSKYAVCLPCDLFCHGLKWIVQKQWAICWGESSNCNNIEERLREFCQQSCARKIFSKQKLFYDICKLYGNYKMWQSKICASGNLCYLKGKKIRAKLGKRQKTVTLQFTVWKFKDLSITQILREIKVGEFRVSKCAILTHWEALHFAFYEFLAHFGG